VVRHQASSGKAPEKTPSVADGPGGREDLFKKKSLLLKFAAGPACSLVNLINRIAGVAG